VWQDGKIVFFVASRGHHSDVGGLTPGSMPPHSKTLLEEGATIVTFKLVRDGIFQVSIWPCCAECLTTTHFVSGIPKASKMNMGPSLPF
jgi:N-methylhydantoinase B/oxoprolinase/acetone carboxylase alpha subunit